MADVHTALLAATSALTVAEERTPEELAAALRAVVELHAPVREGGVFGYNTCSGCDNGSYAIDSPDWPCSTIQVIAEQLGIKDQERIEEGERRG